MNLFAIFSLSPIEVIVILVLGVLLFGRRLPEVGRYLGKGLVEFKKGMKGLEDDLDTTSHMPPPSAPATIEPPRPPQRVATTAPKFQDAPANVPPSPPPQV